MPTYDYVCESCGHELEMFQSMTEGPKRKCPACGTLKLRRRIGTGAAIVFKGSGFYQTDYRSKSYHEAKAADEKAGSTGSSEASDSKSSGKSKAKTKADSKTDGGKQSGGSKGSSAKDAG